MKIYDIKGNQLGYIRDEETGGLTWYVKDAILDEEIHFTGEWAAQEARIHFLDIVDTILNRYIKKVFRSLGIDPATGRRN